MCLCVCFQIFDITIAHYCFIMLPIVKVCETIRDADTFIDTYECIHTFRELYGLGVVENL